MFTKKYRRNIYIIGMSRGEEFIGYIRAGHTDGIAETTKKIQKAEVSKTEKRGKHRLFQLKKYHSEEFAFKLVEYLEVATVTYYDQYDDFKRTKKIRRIYIRVKDKTNPLLEPTFLSEYQNNKVGKSFSSSFDIDNALFFSHSHAYSLCIKLNKYFGEKYEFYKDSYYLMVVRDLQPIREL